MFDWNLVRSFLAAAETGSSAAAARALGTSQPTVSRHVAELELQLAVTLFDRRRDGLVPTDKGLELLEQARAMRAAADGISRRAEGMHDDLAGTVRVTASEVIAIEYMPVAIATIRQAHPQLSVELVSSNEAVDVNRREADIAVRMFEPRQPDLVARHVMDFEIVPCASRAYLERAGAPTTPAELLAHPLVGLDADLDLAGPRAMGFPLEREHFVFRSDSRLAGNAAVRAGIGIGFVQRPLVERDPELVRLELDLRLPRLPLYVVTHAEMRTSRRMKTVFDALVAHFEALAASGAAAEAR
ncbi:MAG: LysR family transcriptional regulator [Pseudomonadales bacterium]|jgi:DNA-binding transcriptional LysR family regulator|nr:LysR family transcriptional regulator [Pseudomonadales bacterium]